MYPPYIPPTDAAFAVWLLNFETLIAAAPATYGLIAGDAVLITNAANPFLASYPISQAPGTRTPATIATKDNDRAAAEVVIRPYAVRISRNAAVLDANKIAVGVTVISLVPTPIPAPIDAPELAIIGMTPGVGRFSYKTVGAIGKSKPFGSIGVEIFAKVDAAWTNDPAEAGYVGTKTKSPFALTFAGPDVGKKLSLFARFNTRSGPGGQTQPGPWSSPIQTIVT